MRNFLIPILFLLCGFMAYFAQEWANSDESNEEKVLTEMIVSDPLANAEWIESQSETTDGNEYDVDDNFEMQSTGSFNP